MRTAAEDTTVRGVPIAKGQSVVHGDIFPAWCH
ncbi:hypothetical protein ACVWWN_006667 [Mycobacterium sp. URHB0021]